MVNFWEAVAHASSFAQKSSIFCATSGYCFRRSSWCCWRFRDALERIPSTVVS